MPSLNMKGPFPLSEKGVRDNVTKKQAGNYALGDTNKDDAFVPTYVGRSDDDLPSRIVVHISEDPKFKFSYAASIKDAYEKECQNYHDFGPKRNKAHPAKPEGKDWKCPVCKA